MGLKLVISLISAGLGLTAFCPSVLAASHAPGMMNGGSGMTMSLADHLRESMPSCCLAEGAPAEHGVNPSRIEPPRSHIQAAPLITLVTPVSLPAAARRQRSTIRRTRVPDPKFESRSTVKRE